MTSSTLETKPHYMILDGLRGVAAIIVVAFHLFEAHSAGHLFQVINHGYLAVDFFFLLSGFVIGYAYDDRWNKMGLKDFFKRRLIRLQPMVIIGMVIGAICFYFQGGAFWPMIDQTPVWKMLLIMLIGFTLIPVTPSMDIRGWDEMHPLNGPGWSLFFEYIGNLLYALFIRKFSDKLLTVLVVLSAAAVIHLTVMGPNGDVIGGWSVNREQLSIGFSRLMYPFFAGLLLSRVAKLRSIKLAFPLCSLLLVIALAMPRIGGEVLWKNGIYESIIIIVVFPIIVYIGACGKIISKSGRGLCKFLGDISYPLYITHYPLIYIYTAWVYNHKVKLEQGWPIMIITLFSAILIAFGCLKLYDEPVRLWLKRKFASK